MRALPVPTGQLEAALEQLRAAGIDEQTLTVVSEPVSVISAQAEAAEEAVAAEAETDPEQVAREELVAATTDLLRAPRTFVALTAISAIVAVAGVITDAAAVVVGSMVIAPLVGPAMATSVGTVLGDSRLFRRGLARGVGGLVVAVLAATAVAVAIRALGLGPAAVELTAIGQVSVRTRPDLLTLAVALGSGAAGAISLSGAVAATLVGVASASRTPRRRSSSARRRCSRRTSSRSTSPHCSPWRRRGTARCGGLRSPMRGGRRSCRRGCSWWRCSPSAGCSRARRSRRRRPRVRMRR
jgi:uncharacterized hydrophobic protein (TIGR00271 family)